jgi:hypothetical protein
VPARRIGPAGVIRLLRRHLDRVGEPASRIPDAEPAVTKTARAPDRRVGTAADDDGDRLGWRRSDDRVVKVEEPAVVRDRLAGQQLAHDSKAFIHPQAAGRRVHPADRDFVAVLTAYPHAEDEPARSDPGEVGQLAGHQDGMTQRQQVHAGVHGQRRVKHRQRGGLHEPVEPQAAEETDVVAAADMVQACLLGLRQDGAGCLRAPLEQPGRQEHADPGGHFRGPFFLRPGGRGDERLCLRAAV